MAIAGVSEALVASEGAFLLSFLAVTPTWGLGASVSLRWSFEDKYDALAPASNF
jgi:hypothetical protein